MKKTDARKLSSEVQQHNCDLVNCPFNQGQARKLIAYIVGVHYSVACRWVKAWLQGGEDFIKLGQRGCRPIEQRCLTIDQKSILKKLIFDKIPEQIKLPFALWNRKAIQAVIAQMWGVRIAIRTIGDYLKRWDYTPQKPAKRACKRQPKAVKERLDNTYPEFKRRVFEVNANIHWGYVR